MGRDGIAARRRILALIALRWLPPLVMSVVERKFLPGATPLSFCLDLYTHVRFLFALPLYVAFETVVDGRLRTAAAELIRREIVPDHARYARALRTTQRLAASGWAELVVLAAAFAVAISTTAANESASWINGGRDGWTLAGHWMVFVAMPILHFLIFRWYWRFMVWGAFLWRVARMDLRLIATHPDGSGGIGFLGTAQTSFVFVSATQAAAFSAYVGNRILFYGETLKAHEIDLGVALAALLILILGPLLLLTPRLAACKRKAKYAYGRFASEYVGGFDTKWIRDPSRTEDPLGSSDIQSLADLANSFRVTADMNIVLVTRKTLTTAVVLTGAPVLPLFLTLMPVGDLLKLLLSVLK